MLDIRDHPIDIGPAPAAFLVVGIPGSGKSTVATALGRRFPAAAHADDSVMSHMIVSGWRPPGPSADAEASRQILLRARNAALLMDSYFAAGFIPVFDDVVVRRSHLDFYLQSIRARPLHLVVLAPRPEVALARDGGRDKHVAAAWLHLDPVLRSELAGAGLWIDSSELTVEATVDAIIDGTGTRGLTVARPAGNAGASVTGHAGPG
jgi:hypothetical protein